MSRVLNECPRTADSIADSGFLWAKASVGSPWKLFILIMYEKNHFWVKASKKSIFKNFDNRSADFRHESFNLLDLKAACIWYVHGWDICCRCNTLKLAVECKQFCRSQAVILFCYRLGHPENHLLRLSKLNIRDQSIPKIACSILKTKSLVSSMVKSTQLEGITTL